MNERAANLSIDELIRHGAFVRALARRLVKDDSTADDVVQEVWLRALQRPPTHAGSITGWLGRVARNLVRDRANAESARRDREQRPATEVERGAERSDQRSEMVEAIASSFAGLPAPYRDALYMRYYEDKSPPQIAKELDCPLATLKTRLSRGIELLRQDLEQRTCGKSLPSLLAGLAAAHQHSGVTAVSLPVIGGLFVMQKLLTAAVILIVCAAGWWAWSARDVERVDELATNVAKSELAHVNQADASPAIATDERETVPTTPATIARVPTGPMTRIHVIDGNRTALSAVQIHAVSDTTVVLLGSTDTDGYFGPQSLSPSIARLAFSLASFAVREVPPPKDQERELEVVLDRGGSISGRVVEYNNLVLPPDQQQPVAGVRVIALRQPSSPRAIFDRLLIDDPSIHYGITDAKGAFSIDGLVLGDGYFLRAGARGFIRSTRNQPPTSLPVVPSEGVVIEMEHAYGVTFEFVDGTSDKLIAIADFAGGVSFGSRDRRVPAIVSPGIEAFLAGLDPNLYADKSRLTVLASSPEAQTEVGPIYVDAHLIGYESATVEALAGPLTGTIPLVRVPLEQTAAAFGTIGFTWLSTNASVGEIGPQPMSMGELRLLGADATQIQLAVPLQLGIEHTLRRVPVGSYQWSVSANYHLFNYPPVGPPAKPILVEANKLTSITVPLEQSGSIQLQVERADGVAYESQLQFQLKRDGQGGGFTTFVAPPYRIIALDPGTYTFDFFLPVRITSTSERQPAPVVVTAGAESVVRVRLP